MIRISERLLNLEESQTIGMARKARELKANGIDVINLSLGEPDFVTPEHIRNAAKKAIDEGFTFYTPVAGIPELKQAISHKFRTENGLDYAPEQIVASTGAKQSIMNVVLATVNPGDEVILFTPYWVSYKPMVEFAQGVPVLLTGPLEQQFKPTPAQLEAAITSKTKAIMFSSPCNPTGAVFSRSELEAIADVLRKYPEILVISDEIYELISFDGPHVSIGSLPGMLERTITVNGVSKGFAMTGWRLGYIGAPKPIADACDKVQGLFTSAPAGISQKAALEAIIADKSPSLAMREAFLERRNLVYAAMSNMQGLKCFNPGGAFYLFPDVSAFFGKISGDGTKINNAEDLCMYLLNDAHVSTVSGEPFGAPQCLRLSYAAGTEQLAKAMERISAALSKLN